MQKVNLKKRYMLIILGCIILIILDQFVKIYIIENIDISRTIIPNLLKFTYIANTGGAFGVGQGNIISFIISNVIVIGIVIRFMITQQERLNPKINIILAFIIAGGTSNLIDRIARGFVVDYIDITSIVKFPKFNLADIYIVIAWICLAIYFVVEVIKDKRDSRQKRLMESNQKVEDNEKMEDSGKNEE